MGYSLFIYLFIAYSFCPSFMTVGFLGVNLHILFFFNSIYYSFTSYRITPYYYLVLIDQYKVRKSTTLRPMQVSARGWRPI